MGKLIVYNVRMAEIVKYNNDMNDVVFADFTDTELKIFFAICSQIRDKQNNEVVFTFDQLKSLTDEKRHYSTTEYAQLMESIYHKMLHLSFKYDDGHDKAGEFLIFQSYERSLAQETITVRVADRYVYFFNELTSRFTRFELNEFVNLPGKYSKLLFRLLKQYKSTGVAIYDFSKLRLLLDVPENYQNKAVTQRVIDPSVEKLRKLYAFRNLTYSYTYNKRAISGIKFEWDKEVVDKLTDKTGENLAASKNKSRYVQSVPEYMTGNVNNEELTDKENEEMKQQIFEMLDKMKAKRV